MIRRTITRSAILVGVLAASGCSQPVRVLMVVGGGYHDYETLPRVLADRLEKRGDVEVDVTADLQQLHPETATAYDVLMFNTCLENGLDAPARVAILDHLRAGRGIVSMHCALWSFQDWPEWCAMLGGFAPGHDKFGPYSVTVLEPEHPAMAGVDETFTITDEPYTVDRRDPNAEILIRTTDVHRDREGKLRDGPEPQVWVRRGGPGRILVATFGHDDQAQSNEEFLTLMHNGILWAAGRLSDEP